MTQIYVGLFQIDISLKLYTHSHFLLLRVRVWQFRNACLTYVRQFTVTNSISSKLKFICMWKVD